nr:hypothetical protein BgiMline_015122 [Biomphalaria glabrata]
MRAKESVHDIGSLIQPKMFVILKALVFAFLIDKVYTGSVSCHPHNCIAGQAYCQDYGSNCVCYKPYSWGRGDFACYRDNEISAEVKNDPELTTFNNDTVKFQYPCRYLLTELELQLQNAHGKEIGQCFFKVHAFHKRINGKIVVDGLEIAAKFLVGYDHEKSLSIITYGQEGHVTLGGTDNHYLDNGPYDDELTHGPVIYSDSDSNLHVKRYLNSHNRQYVFEVEGCGFRSTFVPFDLHDGIKSAYIPGISVAVDCDNHPQWLNTHKVLALPPASQGGPTIGSIAHEVGLTRQQAMAYRAFTAHVEQSQPDSCQQCTDVADSFKKCSDHELSVAWDKCYWILDTPSFIRCISKDYPDTSSESHLSYFATCIEHYCDGFHQCDELRKCSCHNDHLDNILTSTCKY